MNISKSVTDFIEPLWLKPRDLYRSIKRGEAKKVFKEQILRTQDSNLKMASAIGLGIFMGIIPLWGFQTIIAIFLAAFFRLNKIIVLLTTNISIPPLIPLVLYISFLTGGFIFNQSINIDFDKKFDFENIQNDLFQYYLGAIVLATLSGIFVGVMSYLLLLIFRQEVKPAK